jgi:hypothetical protein
VADRLPDSGWLLGFETLLQRHRRLRDNRSTMEVSSFDLVYLESDPRTQQPSGCIRIRTSGTGDYAGVKGEKLITGVCFSFVELDAEIRRLHAELDEVRARAKRKFYKAHAAACR